MEEYLIGALIDSDEPTELAVFRYKWEDIERWCEVSGISVQTWCEQQNQRTFDSYMRWKSDKVKG